jgi:hypothetical protein
VSAFPGDPRAVSAVAALLADRGASVASVGHGLADDLRATRWTGPAAEAASRHVGSVAGSMDRLSRRHEIARSALEEYAAVLDAQQRIADRARSDQVAAYRVLQRGLDPAACLDLVRAEVGLRGARVAIDAAASTAAARIRSAADPDTQVSFDGNVLLGASWHPRDVTQSRTIGDCYLLSTLMGYLRTDAGDRLLRRNIRWDEEADGYWVSLYDDGEPVEYFVDWTYLDGVRDPTNANFQVGVAAIYEAAVGQHLGTEDLSDGGWPTDVMALISGSPGTTYSTHHTWYNPWDREYAGDTVLSALTSGASVTAETPRGARCDVQYYEDGQLRDDQFDIAGPHSYMVVGVADDGSVVLRNPWGTTDPPTSDGGRVFRVSEDDFLRCFSQVTVSEPA